MLKYSERAQGTPFAALATKVTKSSFLVSLSGLEHDRQRNLQLLKERSWFDIPMVYAKQRRGILAVEKGSRGEQIFREAMAEWERSR
jgi:exoribonuclease R